MGVFALMVIFLYFLAPEPIRNHRVEIMLGILVLALFWLFGWFLKPEEKKPVIVIVILFFFSTIFWAVFEQAGSSFNLFARDFTDLSVPGWLVNILPATIQTQFANGFLASWFQSVNSIYLILLAPVFSVIWLKLGARQPSSPAKFSLAAYYWSGLAQSS